MLSLATSTYVVLFASSIASVAARPWVGGAKSSLIARQTNGGSGPNFPPQCSSQCSAITAATNACPDDSCLCTAANMNSLKICLQCVANLLNDIPDVQESLNEITGNCTLEGFPVPKETLTGGGSNNGGSNTGGGNNGGNTDGGIFSTSAINTPSTPPPASAPSPIGNNPLTTKPIFSAPSAAAPTPIAASPNSPNSAPASGGTSIPSVGSNSGGVPVFHLPQTTGVLLGALMLFVGWAL